jgi:O-antigen/teichoic acid export membrane protein
MEKRKILINAVMSTLQVLVVGGSLFILYKVLLKTIGVEKLGIWSLVLATTSVTQVANFGLAGSTVRFVAKYMARNEQENISNVIQTAALSIAGFMGTLLVIVYPLIKWILSLVIPSASYQLAVEILPASVFALWLMIIASVFSASLDGCQLIYIRNLIFMGGTIIFLILCFIFTPVYGLIGLAYAQIVQNFVIMLISWLSLKKFISILPLFPYKWRKELFKEMIGYGINFQIISVTIMLYEPITKALLSKFGNLAMVGYYEMANRMIQQFRALLISANQVLVPAFANLQERMPEKIKTVYLTSYQLLFYLSAPLYALIIISAPLISEIWIGHYENSFILFAILLSIGWFLNTLNVPAYIANLGTGELRWNVIGHITIAVLNLGIGYSLGALYDGIGVAVGWVIALAIGSSMIYLAYHLMHKIPLIELIPKGSRIIVMMCLVGVTVSLIIQNQLIQVQGFLLFNYIMVAIFSIIIFILLWLHPMRKCLIGWITTAL